MAMRSKRSLSLREATVRRTLVAMAVAAGVACGAVFGSWTASPGTAAARLERREAAAVEAVAVPLRGPLASRLPAGGKAAPPSRDAGLVLPRAGEGRLSWPLPPPADGDFVVERHCELIAPWSGGEP